MGFFKPTAFISGLAKGGLDLFDKAEKAGEEGLENLKLARDEVNEEIATMKDNYDKAIQIGDNVENTYNVLYEVEDDRGREADVIRVFLCKAP